MSRTITPLCQKNLDLLSRINQYKVSIQGILIIAIILATLMFGKNIHARWWVIDDHEIVSFLGNDHVLPVNEILGKLFYETEVGKYLMYPRFRPVYYIFRLLECWAWGENQALWYIFRISIYTLFISTFWFFTARKVGNIIGSLLTIYVATSHYWVDIVSRLGPSEIYAALGLTIFGLGIKIVYESNRVAGWWLLFLGSIICSGAKENFLFLLAPLTFIVWYSYKRGDLNWVRSALFASAFLWMIWIGYTIFISARSFGGDIYKNSVNFTDRFLTLLKALERLDVIALLFLCALILFLKPLLHSNKPDIHKHFTEEGAVSILLTLSYLSQIFFYNGHWPIGNRYDFPGLLVFPLLLTVLIRKLSISNNLNKFRGIFVLSSLVGILVLLTSSAINIRESQLNSQVNVKKTASFTEKVKEWALIGKNNPNYAIIIQTDDPGWDYEPVFSYVRFLRYYGVQNKIAFLWAGRPPDKYINELDRSLAKDLSNLSSFGEIPMGLMSNVNDFTPFPDIDKLETGCILIVISGEPEKNCSLIIAGQWR